MAIHRQEEGAPWYASLWVLLLAFLVVALETVWYTLHSRQQTLVTQAQRPDSTVVRPRSS